MQVFIVAGSPEASPPQLCAPRPGDRVIAADLGAMHARAWGWPVHLVIGDLDSLPAHDVAALRADGVPLITAPPAKDETDLELALEQAVALGGRPSAIIICGAFGGRVDHMLANVLLLARPDLAGLDVMLAEGNQVLRTVRGGEVAPGSLTMLGSAGDLLTLLPIAGDAQGITTEGLLYPLRDETLFLGQARGVSNVFADRVARIVLRRGLLLVIHTVIGGT